MKLKRYIGLLLAGVMMLSLTGCMGHLYDKAGEINGAEISSGLYLMAEYSAYNEANALREDTEKSVFNQKVEGQSANSWITDRTEEILRRYVCVRELCREYGININSDETAYSNVETMLQYWTYLEETYAERGISQETYIRFLTYQELGTLLFQYLYAEGGELAVPDEELKAGYEEQYAYISGISVPLTSGADGVDMREEVVAAAEEIVAQLRGGMTLATAAEQELPEIYKTLEREFDATSAAEGIYNTYIKYDQADTGTYNPSDLERLKETGINDYGILVTSSTVVIYQKLAMFTDDTEFQNKRSEVLTALKSDEFEDYLANIYNAYEVDWTFGVQWYLSPKKAANES